MVFAKKHFDNIASGQKLATTRRGHRDVVGGVQRIESDDGSIVAYVRLWDWTHLRFCELSEEHARKEGLQSLDELKHALRGFYPEIGDDDPVTFIEFRFMEWASPYFRR